MNRRATTSRPLPPFWEGDGILEPKVRSEEFPFSDAWDATEFPTLELPKQELVLPFAPIPGIVALYGHQKSLKTTTGLAMGLSLATGTPFLGWQPTRRLRVCYINFEGVAAQVVQKCLQLMGTRKQEDLKAMIDEGQFKLLHMVGKRWNYSEPFSLAEIECQERMISEIKYLRENGRGPDAVFIDNVSTAFRGLDENSNSEVVSINYFLEEIRDLGLLVVFLHHTGKLRQGEKVTAGKMRGASAWSAGVDTSIALQRNNAKDDDLEEVSAQWTFDAERGVPCHPNTFEVHLREYGHKQCSAGDPAFLRLAARKSYPGKVLTYLRHCHDQRPQSPKDLQTALQCRERTCYNRASDAARLGLVEPGRRTILTPAGLDAIGKGEVDD